jgi:hypothetical protein
MILCCFVAVTKDFLHFDVDKMRSFVVFMWFQNLNCV